VGLTLSFALYNIWCVHTTYVYKIYVYKIYVYKIWCVCVRGAGVTAKGCDGRGGHGRAAREGACMDRGVAPDIGPPRAAASRLCCGVARGTLRMRCGVAWLCAVTSAAPSAAMSRGVTDATSGVP
jgi:hypothetical protein